MRLDRVLANLIYAPFLTKDRARWSFGVPSNLGSSMIPWVYLICYKI